MTVATQFIPVCYEGVPIERGLYVCWIDGDFPIQANRVLLLWENDRWEYQLSDQRFRGTVYQWLGPLPRLEVPA